MKDRKIVLEKIKDKITPNVYFTPPDNIQLKFPACVVTREDFEVKKANNNPYFSSMGYKLVYMSREEADDIFIKVSSAFKYSSFRTEYKVNGLYHKVFVVYE